MKFLTTILLFFSLSARATTYYISPSGNDGAAGSAGAPWLTLYHATQTVTTAGDIIHVNAGSYTETTQCTLAPGVSIEGDGISSIVRSTLTADFSAIILAASGTMGTDGNQHISFLNFDGQSLATSVAISVRARKNFSVHDCSFQDFKFSAINMSGFLGFFAESFPPTPYATDNTIYNNTIINCAGFGVWSGGAIYGSGSIYAVGQKDFLVHHNKIINQSRPDGENGWPIKITDWTQGMKIYSNELKRKPYAYASNGWPVFGSDYWDFAIEGGDVQGLEVYDNIIHGSIDLNRNTPGAYAYSVYIHDNIIKGDTAALTTNYNAGIILEFETEKAIIENNTIDKVTNGVAFSIRPGGHLYNMTIRKNNFKNVKAGSGAGGIAFIGGGVRNYVADTFDIYNNTITAAASDPATWPIDFSFPLMMTKLRFKNNIVKGFNAGGAAIVSRNLDSFFNCQIQYNNFNGNSSSDDPFPSWVEDISNLHVSSTYSNTIKTDPALAGAVDSLSTGSPCIDAGVNVGLAYNGSAPDIGYWESGGPGVPDTDPPATSAFNPSNGSTGKMPGSATVIITFDEPMNEATLNGTNITGITGTFTAGSDYVSIACTLSPSTTYNITIGTGCEDVAGNNLASPVSYSFTTGAAPVSTSGKYIIRVRGAKVIPL